MLSLSRADRLMNDSVGEVEVTALSIHRPLLLMKQVPEGKNEINYLKFKENSLKISVGVEMKFY